MNNPNLSEKQNQIVLLMAENKMNIREVSRIMMYHYNTIAYHLDQIKARTGKDPRNLNDLAELLGWVQVVRCEECEHCVDAHDDGFMYCMRPVPSEDYSETGFCYPLEVRVGFYEFCSHGKRKKAEPKCQDNCAGCDVPDNPRYYDPESEDYFDCSDCACYRCPYLHDCSGQCGAGLKK